MRQLVYVLIVSVTAFATVAVGATAFAVSLIPVDVAGAPQDTPPITVEYDPDLVVPAPEAVAEGLKVADPLIDEGPDEPAVGGESTGNTTTGPGNSGVGAGNSGVGAGNGGGNGTGNEGNGNLGRGDGAEDPGDEDEAGSPGTGNNGVGVGNGGGNGTGNEGNGNPGKGNPGNGNPGNGKPGNGP